MGVTQRQQRHSHFSVNTLEVVKMDTAVNHRACLRGGSQLVAADALYLENG